MGKTPIAQQKKGVMLDLKIGIHHKKKKKKKKNKNKKKSDYQISILKKDSVMLPLIDYNNEQKITFTAN